MTYKETCEYLYSQLPMFEQQGASGYKEGLENSVKLDEHFGFPHRNYRTITLPALMAKAPVPIRFPLSCRCVAIR